MLFCVRAHGLTVTSGARNARCDFSVCFFFELNEISGKGSKPRAVCVVGGKRSSAQGLLNKRKRGLS